MRATWESAAASIAASASQIAAALGLMGALELNDYNVRLVAMGTYDPMFVGEQFCSGLITGGLISAELWLGLFLLLKAFL
jgi:hypothetical protein